MDWKYLKESLGRKPLVLAGPMLRKTTSTSVTVWLALKQFARVTLTVTDEQGKPVMSGDGEPVAVGTNLYILAVTAEPVNGPLSEGVVYQYDLAFDTGTNSISFSTAMGSNAPLNYGALTKPSFSLPPKDLNRLRILQGSCRMPHADGRDTLPLIDDLLATTASNAYARPHQLLMTGDQIYADDVSRGLLLMLIEASDVLLGWTERMPGFEHNPEFPVPVPPGMRNRLLGPYVAGFTSNVLHSHLMSLGEYLCMYLFVWSPVLWPDTLPSYAQVMEPMRKRLIMGASDWKPRTNETAINKELAVLAAFSKDLWKVRRVLANVPSYMVFDDHEVTDDWNMTRNFCADVYGNDLGKRIVQNALVAYSLCQHWGNVPEQFDGPSTPGGSLIALLQPAPSSHAPPTTPLPAPPSSGGAARYDQNSQDLRKLLGMHDFDVQKWRKDSANFHDPGTLLYDFTVEGDAHQILFTDTRSWRSYPKGSNSPGHLLPKNEITRQITEKKPSLGSRLLIVVLSTNAPPVGPIRAAAREVWLSQKAQHNPDIFEAWEIPSVPFDRLLTALTERLPKEDGRHNGPVILLSGDVHFSFASRIVFRADFRFEAQRQAPATAVIVQLVASSFKNQTKDTIGFQDHGYTFVPHWAIPYLVNIPPDVKEGYVGWDVQPGTKLNIGTCRMKMETFFAPDVVIEGKTPTFALQVDNPAVRVDNVKLTKKPDYRYQLDYLTPTSQGGTIPPGPIIQPLPAGDRKKAAQAFAAANSHYRLHRASPGMCKIIGVNNFSEITFDWGATPDKRKVNHTLRWFSFLPLLPQTWTTYSVSLNPDDTPDIKDGKN